jgi:hypothetical protein
MGSGGISPLVLKVLTVEVNDVRIWTGFVCLRIRTSG